MNSQIEIETLLEQETTSALALCDILKSERSALADNKLDSLEALSGQKQAQVEELEKLGRSRLAWLDSQGVSANEQDMKAFFAQSGNGLKQNWEKLMAQLEECQQLNRVNGSIVEQLQRNIKNALAILQGRPDDADVYGRSGKMVSDPAANILSRA